MQFLLRHRAGLIGGFLFGTVGIFLIALLSLMLPIVELLATPFLLPGKFFAAVLAGPSASTPMVLFLYLCVGIFYALLGLAIDFLLSFIRNRQSAINQ